MNGTRPVVLFSVFFLLVVAAGGPAFATTRNVPSASYPTIQSAINAAVNGDVVVVAEGTYYENINFKGKAIKVRSTNPLSKTVVAATIINGHQAGSVVTFKSGETAKSVLSGFTLTNGSGTVFDQYGDTEGGGAYCNSSSPTLIHDTISDNGAYYGGGVYCQHSSPTLADNRIDGNSVPYGLGGGVDCEQGSSPTLISNIIIGNSASNGNGGGVNCESGCSLTLTRNSISGNSATYGGGVYFNNSSPSLLTNNTISGNLANYGGGVYCYQTSPTLTNNTLSGNSAIYGGGVFCQTSSSPIIKNTIIALNTAGGGLYVADTTSKPVVTYCDVYGNTGGNYLNFPIQTGKNGNISVAPRFANPAAGNFYLMSQYGRWAPAMKKWVLDKVTSPCINAGDPKSAFNLEPAPNGGRINMGAQGDTPYASKSASATSSSVAALTVSAAAAQPLAGGRQALVFTLSASASVQVEIVNIAGRPIRELAAGEAYQAGVNTLSWDGLSAAGTPVPNGIYLVRLIARTPGGAQAQALVTCTVRR